MITIVDNGTNGGQIYLPGPSNSLPVTIAGLGWVEAVGRLGALRLEGGTQSGPVTLSGNARIGAYATNANSIITGTIGGAFQLAFWDGNGTETYTLTPSAANTYGSTLVDTGAVVVAGNANALSTGGMATSGGTLKTNGFNFSFANLSVRDRSNPKRRFRSLDGHRRFRQHEHLLRRHDRQRQHGRAKPNQNGHRDAHAVRSQHLYRRHGDSERHAPRRHAE